MLGGDTTHGEITVVSITLIGHSKSRRDLITRSGATAGDLIFVTGALGASTAGLKLFQNKIPGFAFEKKKHLNPTARIGVSSKIAKFATAMEDVSDGLASEVRNICLASRTGAVIFAEKIPIRKTTIEAAERLGDDARDYANFGGEDFELVFTVNEKDESRAKKFGTLVGVVTRDSGKVCLSENGRKRQLTRFGFDHFLA
ncbi:Thiamine-monophosphate kinase [uncultured archaeon]|nr:Thiamine-monophosphate kinase [uncultured archaeon]